MVEEYVCDKTGRLCVELRKDGVTTTRYVDELVMEAFVGPMKAGEMVVYGEGGITDTSVENLSYGPKKGADSDG